MEEINYLEQIKEKRHILEPLGAGIDRIVFMNIQTQEVLKYSREAFYGNELDELYDIFELYSDEVYNDFYDDYATGDQNEVEFETFSDIEELALENQKINIEYFTPITELSKDGMLIKTKYAGRTLGSLTEGYEIDSYEARDFMSLNNILYKEQEFIAEELFILFECDMLSLSEIRNFYKTLFFLRSEGLPLSDIHCNNVALLEGRLSIIDLGGMW